MKKIALAVGASVLAHAVLFFAMGWVARKVVADVVVRPPTPSSHVLRVEMMGRSHAAAVAEVPRVVAVAAVARRAAVSTKTVGGEVPVEVAQVEAPAVAAKEVEGEVVAAVGGAVAAALPRGPGLGTEGVGGVDTVRLHALLAAAAERCYPQAAKTFRLRGECEVRFCVGDSGQAGSIELKTTTGSAVLDGAARECVVQQAAPFPREIVAGCYLVPVRFGR